MVSKPKAFTVAADLVSRNISIEFRRESENPKAMIQAVTRREQAVTLPLYNNALVMVLMNLILWT